MLPRGMIVYERSIVNPADITSLCSSRRESQRLTDPSLRELDDVRLMRW